MQGSQPPPPLGFDGRPVPPMRNESMRRNPSQKPQGRLERKISNAGHWFKSKFKTHEASPISSKPTDISTTDGPVNNDNWCSSDEFDDFTDDEFECS